MYIFNMDKKEITFSATIGDFDIEVCIYNASKNEEAFANVRSFRVFDKPTGIKLDFQFTNDTVPAGVSVITPKKEYHFLQQKDIWSDGISSDIIGYLSGLTNPIFNIIEPKNKKTSNDRDSMLRVYESQINDIIDRFKKSISKIHLEYIYSHDAGQRVLFNKKDENDYVSKSIHDFYNQRITSKSPLGKDFVCNWMRKFCGIDDYRIKNIQGEAYQFELKSEGKWVNLADMGRGAIQVVTLLVRVASIIKKYSGDGFVEGMPGEIKVPIVLVEEPEQNLHPALQSQLTELFCDVHEKYGIRFIIETHSEYMVRKSQVMVAEGRFKDEIDLAENCPFKTFYFPKDSNPYDMTYTTSGHFKYPFGSGFLDEAGKSALALSKMERDRRKEEA